MEKTKVKEKDVVQEAENMPIVEVDYERALHQLVEHGGKEFQNVFHNLDFYKSLDQEKLALNKAVVKEFHQSLNIQFVGSNMNTYVTEDCARYILTTKKKDFDAFCVEEYEKHDVQESFLRLFINSTLSLVRTGIMQDIKREAYEEKYQEILQSRYGVTTAETLNYDEQQEFKSLMELADTPDMYKEKINDYEMVILDAIMKLKVHFVDGEPTFDNSYYDNGEEKKEYVYQYIPMREIRHKIMEELKKTNVLLNSVTTKEKIGELLGSVEFRENFKQCCKGFDRYFMVPLYADTRVRAIIKEQNLNNLDQLLQMNIEEE